MRMHLRVSLVVAPLIVPFVASPAMAENGRDGAVAPGDQDFLRVAWFTGECV